MKLIAMCAVLAVAGCATTETVWDKPGSTDDSFLVDTGQCRAQAFSVALPSAMQSAMIYGGCMNGKGWRNITVPIAAPKSTSSYIQSEPNYGQLPR